MRGSLRKIYLRIKNDIRFMNLKNKILIYQMGKVGSTSLEKSIENSIHWHSFYPFYLQKIYKSKFNKLKIPYRIIYPIEFFLMRLMVKRQIKKDIEINIITLVREPISRNISWLFQVAPLVLYKHYFHVGKRENLENTLKFMEEEFYKNIWHESAEEWFERDFQKITGINVFEHGFDKTKGYTVIRKNNINVLVLKMETLYENEKIIGEFIKNRNFKLNTDNISSNKWYRDLYKSFKENFKPDQDYIDRLYNGKYMNHFYSKSEIESHKNKWLKKEVN